MGDSKGNALAETNNGLYKTEVIYRRSWSNLQQVELATLDWVHGLNHKRLLGLIGRVLPAEAEEAYYRLQADQAKAVPLKPNGLYESRSGSHRSLVAVWLLIRCSSGSKCAVWKISSD